MRLNPNGMFGGDHKKKKNKDDEDDHRNGGTPGINPKRNKKKGEEAPDI
jgi:hypothetical protein